MSSKRAAEIRIELARGHVAIGEHLEALACLERAVAEDPGTPGLLALIEDLIEVWGRDRERLVCRAAVQALHEHLLSYFESLASSRSGRDEGPDTSVDVAVLDSADAPPARLGAMEGAPQPQRKAADALREPAAAQRPELEPLEPEPLEAEPLEPELLDAEPLGADSGRDLELSRSGREVLPADEPLTADVSQLMESEGANPGRELRSATGELTAEALDPLWEPPTQAADPDAASHELEIELGDELDPGEEPSPRARSRSAVPGAVVNEARVRELERWLANLRESRSRA